MNIQLPNGMGGYTLWTIEEDGSSVFWTHLGECLWPSEEMAREVAQMRQTGLCAARSFVIAKRENLTPLEATRGMCAGVEEWWSELNTRLTKDREYANWCVKVRAISPDGAAINGYVACDALSGSIGFQRYKKCRGKEVVGRDGCDSSMCFQLAPQICMWNRRTFAEKCATSVQNAYQSLGWQIRYAVVDFKTEDEAYRSRGDCTYWTGHNKSGQYCLYLCSLIAQNMNAVNVLLCGNIVRRGYDDPQLLLNGSVELNDWMLSSRGIEKLQHVLLTCAESQVKSWPEWSVRDAIRLASKNRECSFAAALMRRKTVPLALRLDAFSWSSLSYVTDWNYDLWHPYARKINAAVKKLPPINDDFFVWESMSDAECLDCFQRSQNQIGSLTMILRTGRISIFESLCREGLLKRMSKKDLVYLVSRYSPCSNYFQLVLRCFSAIDRRWPGSIISFRDGEGNGVLWYAVPIGSGCIFGPDDVWNNSCTKDDYKEFVSGLERFGCDPQMKNVYGISWSDLSRCLYMGDYWYNYEQ